MFKMNFTKPTKNIALLGSVSDGKSTCVRQLTGIKTQRHSSEQQRNITIKPGYANMKIWYNIDTDELKTSDSKTELDDCELIDHISFIDCPGHNDLILTALGSIRLLDAVIVVVSAGETLDRKPQLKQHLAAIKLAQEQYERDIPIIVCLNKLDLVSKDVALERYDDLLELLETYNIEPRAIIPTSFNKNLGIDYLLQEMVNHFLNIDNNTNNDDRFLIIRSFDINRKGIDIMDINGGVLGGSLLDGHLQIGDEIEIRPGIIGKGTVTPIITKILSLKTDQTELTEITKGGLIGIGTDIDPYYCVNDKLAGNVIGLVGTLPNVYSSIQINFTKITEFDFDWTPSTNDEVYLQIETNSIPAIHTNNFNFRLRKPACIDNDTLIIVCVKHNGIKIAGYGKLIDGNKII